MDNGHDYQLPRFRKFINFGLVTTGLALFIALGLRGAQQVGDRAVVAGQKNHAQSFGTDSQLLLPGQTTSHLAADTIYRTLFETPKSGPGQTNHPAHHQQAQKPKKEFKNAVYTEVTENTPARTNVD